MPHAFPEETVSAIRKIVDINIKKSFKVKRTPYQWADGLFSLFGESNYGFTDNLLSGLYAPYHHEKDKYLIGTDNCTTIIPSMYIFCELVGLKPEIVQFVNLKDIEKFRDRKINPNEINSHSAVIVDVGRKHKYIMDPFMGIFGPVIRKRKK